MEHGFAPWLLEGSHALKSSRVRDHPPYEAVALRYDDPVEH